MPKEQEHRTGTHSLYGDVVHLASALTYTRDYFNASQQGWRKLVHLSVKTEVDSDSSKFGHDRFISLIKQGNRELSVRKKQEILSKGTKM